MRNKEVIDSLTYTQYSATKDSGGKIVTLRHVVCMSVTDRDWKNQMRRLKKDKGKRFWPLYIWLITEFNGQAVVW